MLQCYVSGCTTKSGQLTNCGVKYVLHVFPKDPHLSDVWVVRSGKKARNDVKNSRMCEKHFSNEQYRRNFLCEFGLVGKDRHRRGMLREDAVPDQALPNEKHNAATNAENFARRERMAEEMRKKIVVALLEETDNNGDTSPVFSSPNRCKFHNDHSYAAAPPDVLNSSLLDSMNIILTDPKIFSITATEEVITKQEDETTIYLEESCYDSKTFLDELSKSNNADGKPASSATVGAEANPSNDIEMVEVKEEKLDSSIVDHFFTESNYADGKPASSATVGAETNPLNDIEMVEVKEEKLDDLTTVKLQPLHCNEDLLLEKSLVTGGGSEDDLSWRDPASTGKLATLPPLSSEEGSSSVEENKPLSDLDFEAVQVDKMHEGGIPSLFRFNCSLCPYASNSRRIYTRHLITHENRPKTFSCTQCKFRSCYKVSLERHLLIHSNERAKDFSCSQCAYKTDRLGSLRAHELIHLPNRDKPYSCAHCHFKSACKGTLAIHVKTHDIKREGFFSCTMCSYSTHNKVNLRYHMRHHETNLPKPLTCHQCDFRTDFKNRLRSHLLSHEKGSKQHTCSLCPFASNYISNYKKHLLSHDAKAKMFVCPQCPYSTHSNGHYERHEKACSRSKIRVQS